MAAIVLPRRRTLKRIAIYVVVTFILLKLFLPADNVIFLALHWRWHIIKARLFESQAGTTAWVLTRGQHIPDFITNVGILIKTGYGTRDRLPAQLEALGLREWDPDRVLVVADFSNIGNMTEHDAVIQDAVGGLLKSMRGTLETGNVPRFRKYASLKQAVDEGDDAKARSIGKNVGWELDALKVSCSWEHIFLIKKREGQNWKSKLLTLKSSSSGAWERCTKHSP